MRKTHPSIPEYVSSSDRIQDIISTITDRELEDPDSNEISKPIRLNTNRYALVDKISSDEALALPGFPSKDRLPGYLSEGLVYPVNKQSPEAYYVLILVDVANPKLELLSVEPVVHDKYEELMMKFNVDGGSVKTYRCVVDGDVHLHPHYADYVLYPVDDEDLENPYLLLSCNTEDLEREGDIKIAQFIDRHMLAFQRDRQSRAEVATLQSETRLLEAMTNSREIAA